MNQADLEPMQRMARRQQLETSKVRGQDERALAGVLRREIVPDVEPIVADAARQAPVEESAQPNVLGAGPAKVHVRGAQDAASLRVAQFGKRDLEIADSDSHVTAVEAIDDQTACLSQFVENEVGEQAERVQHSDHQPEDQPILEAQRDARARRDSTRERKVRLLRAVSRSAGAAPRFSISPTESSDSRRSSSGLADEGADTIVCGALYNTDRSRLGPLGITTRPESVTKNRCRSRSRSYPISSPSGT